ncbi:NACHT, LRR and PYD domains-containing protein 14-like, partial [Dysidea avara]|uniref:NACHT, LRR and PYD domains-containing protein 14-like n=1 Tax=Dysidea avara TaxID=196820 RepID=UPI003317CA04
MADRILTSTSPETREAMPFAEFRKDPKRTERATMKDIENHVVVRWAPQWRQLGRQLRIEEHQMNIIEHDHPNNCEECCSKMLSDWLEQNTYNDTTWEVLIRAIDKLPEDIPSFVEDIQSVVAATTNHLRTCYDESRFSSTEDEWPPYQPKHYTTLALIHSGNESPVAAVISVAQELAVAGNIVSNSVLQTSRNPESQCRITKNISDIFAPVVTPDGSTRDPNMILIEGAPGIGKTVLAKEIAFQWAKNKLLATKKLLFLLSLRDFNVNNAISIEDFVQYAVKSTEIVHWLVTYLFNCKGKNVVIVLDGYDEISDNYRKKSFITNIIHRRIFPQCCIVITSRPTASSHLRNLVDCRVEIVGFTEEDRFDYIQTALEGKDEQVKALQQYLQSNPTINALCYIPLNMTILLCLAENGLD